MAYKTPVSVSLSGNQWIDGLTEGFRWGIGPEDPVVGYTFIGDTSNLSIDVIASYPSWGWSDVERSQMERAMDAIEAVCALRFFDRGDDVKGDVEISFYTLDAVNSEGNFGFAFSPGSGLDQGLLAVNWSLYRTMDGELKNSISPGSFYGVTFLHELSHVVGLKHPHDEGSSGQPRFPGLSASSDEFSDKGDFEQNAHPFTQLSYVDKGAGNGLVPDSKLDYGFLGAPGALDVAALQWLYGINSEAASGNDVYRLPSVNQEGSAWTAIWDTGGTDRISAAKISDSVIIDLRNATLGDDANAGGFVSRVVGVNGGYTIAYDWDGRDLVGNAGLCIIESAIGGRGDDLLIGNSSSNRLKGMHGDDILYAGLGIGNRVTGGKGCDQFLIQSGANAYVEITDFRHRHDQLVFDVLADSVVFLEQGGHTNVYIDDLRVATLLDQVKVDPVRNVLFSGFDAYGL